MPFFEHLCSPVRELLANHKWSISPTSRYDVALLYLQQSQYDLDAAIAAYQEDEKWEKEHPMQGNVKGKGKGQNPRRRKFGGFGITGQLS